MSTEKRKSCIRLNITRFFPYFPEADWSSSGRGWWGSGRCRRRSCRQRSRANQTWTIQVWSAIENIRFVNSEVWLQYFNTGFKIIFQQPFHFRTMLVAEWKILVQSYHRDREGHQDRVYFSLFFPERERLGFLQYLATSTRQTQAI